MKSYSLINQEKTLKIFSLHQNRFI